MEKDEKIRRTQSQRSRFIALSVAAIFVVGVILLVMNDDRTGGQSNSNGNHAGHHPVLTNQLRQQQVVGTMHKSLGDIRKAHQHDPLGSHVGEGGDTNNNNNKNRHAGGPPLHVRPVAHVDAAARAQEMVAARNRNQDNNKNNGQDDLFDDETQNEENQELQQHQDDDDAAGVQRQQQQQQPLDDDQGSQMHDDKEEQGGYYDNQEDGESEEVLVARVAEYDQNVRKIKAKVVAEDGFMETDPEGVAAAQALQEATRLLLKKRYGVQEPYRVKVDLEFLPSNPTFDAMGPTDTFTIEMAPAALMPHAVFSFLEIARHWDEKKGVFHRRANHVLQVMVHGNHVPHLAFQEYNPKFPHVKGTVGYAGRPSGPAWYVSIMNNSGNHGPGSQQKRNPHEADACFGKVVEGFERAVLGRITKMPGDGFLSPEKHVKITKMTIMVPQGDTGNFVAWQDAAVLSTK